MKMLINMAELLMFLNYDERISEYMILEYQKDAKGLTEGSFFNEYNQILKNIKY
jgi:hypothetical protein